MAGRAAAAVVLVDSIAIAESLEGAEAEMAGACGLRGALSVVADPDTWDAMGARIAAALRRAGRRVREVILERPHATLAGAAALAGRLSDAGDVVVVGSGTLNDLGKYATARERRSCCVFGTAASMDGYTSQTASMRLESGLKISIPAHAPKGVFLDLGVLAAAPPHMAAAGFGDCLCSSVARIDWWMPHRLLGTPYHEEPYLEAVDRIKAIFEEEGATAKISSIHVNGWFGDYDKLSMTRRLAADRLGLDVDAERARVIFCGDSPNDAPMLAHFPNACGVANVRDFSGRLEAAPAWIASARGGEGFSEIAGAILSARAAARRGEPSPNANNSPSLGTTLHG